MENKTNVIKVRFLRGGEQSKQEYTYYTPEPVSIGDQVDVSINQAVVTAVDVPEEEIRRFGDNAKTIIGKSSH